MKKRNKADEKAQKAGVSIFPPPGGATGIVVHCLDATRILPELR